MEKRFYIVSFTRKNSNIWQSNIALAEDFDDVKEYYEKKGYLVHSVGIARDYEVKEAEKKGKPIVTIEHDEKKDALAELEKVASIVKKSASTRSAWDKGVAAYAEELLDGLNERIDYEGYKPGNNMIDDWLRNGAFDWNQFSYGGSALIYDYDIASRLCNNTELKRTAQGEKMPNKSENWLDVQARALRQAARLIVEAYRTVRA